ncbi:MAG TPA: trypsin-like peptidase domain-containing protein [Candidatus Acidoferrum sp.]|nr:trypsin-like peptidase domain-containing protein [Candidatus Acidoferrum sp.]
MSVIGATDFLRAQPACWLLAALLMVPASRAGAQPVPLPNPAPTARPVPKPAPADPRDLPSAFTKPTPGSIADLKLMEQRVKALVTRLSPAVVAVEVGFGSGSGVVISADGLVLTAGHVSGRPGRDVRFTFPDGKTARGKTLGAEHDSDTGLMRITDPGLWPHAPMGDLEHARIGDWVLALGHPGGFDPKRSLVVRLGRIIRLIPEALQTDCTISPGDSGGPLFDMYGRIIGIHSAISSSVSANFHVSVTDFYETWDQLVKGENPSSLEGLPKAYLGATAADDAAGCRLSVVEENGPAFKAGLKVGDLVLKVNEREIMVAASFRRWVAEAEPGETLSLQIKRGDNLLSLDVKLRAPPARKN